jgi:Fe-S cluster biosynthesis and repair protein YggX
LYEENSMSCGSPFPAAPEKPVTRKVFCVKFQKDLPGLDETPFDNELGQRIYEHVSRDAWALWKEHLKMIMNEYRLNLATIEAQELVMKQMEDYFFGEGAALPPDYVPPRTKA